MRILSLIQMLALARTWLASHLKGRFSTKSFKPASGSNGKKPSTVALTIVSDAAPSGADSTGDSSKKLSAKVPLSGSGKA